MFKQRKEKLNCKNRNTDLSKKKQKEGYGEKWKQDAWKKIEETAIFS